MQWLKAQDPPCPWNKSTCSAAALNKCSRILQWLRAQDPPCPWNESTCSAAALNKCSRILQWLRAQDPPCPWDAETCCYAVIRDHKCGLFGITLQSTLQWVRSLNPRVLGMRPLIYQLLCAMICLFCSG